MPPLEDPIAQLLTLKVELRQMEGARDDALKSADDPASKRPRHEYLADAAQLEQLAAYLRAEIAGLETQRRLLQGH
ncbi:hypothetical protein H8A97_24685 [Bradyrhizobium sp. Arg62]|uniref:hypothetical protein n=1 Tax=Bradyrhizobium brasilense TaxID=1419277 RepID=UPI001E5BE208|nr:hypothetical protein [Bradyrhizobium brasilense]MCC8948218.1 hypothetical protein [Bradyrhizobium brasilense]